MEASSSKTFKTLNTEETLACYYRDYGDVFESDCVQSYRQTFLITGSKVFIINSFNSQLHRVEYFIQNTLVTY
jgi:hypothetical protein